MREPWQKRVKPIAGSSRTWLYLARVRRGTVRAATVVVVAVAVVVTAVVLKAQGLVGVGSSAPVRRAVVPPLRGDLDVGVAVQVLQRRVAQQHHACAGTRPKIRWYGQYPHSRTRLALA